MSADEDKYPGESGRRRFVKGVVGGAALAGAGVAGSVSVNSLTTSSGQGGGATEAMAIENIAGPAPRGMPQIPLEIVTESGQRVLKGIWPDVATETQGGIEVTIAEMDLGGKTYSSDWYQYCGIESYEGIKPEYESDNLIRSDSGPPYEWQSELEAGEPIPVSAFEDYESWGNDVGVAGLGKPATATWRSQDTEDTIPVQILRSPLIEQLAETGSAPAPDPLDTNPGYSDGQYQVTNDIQTWLQASTAEGFIAWLNKCTHFCCVPGYKKDPGSAKFDSADEVYCPCHQSVYDPFSIVPTLFTARPRPGD